MELNISKTKEMIRRPTWLGQLAVTKRSAENTADRVGLLLRHWQ